MNIRDKIHKLEQVTEARGATPGEAAAARAAATRLRDQLTPEPHRPPTGYVSYADALESFHAATQATGIRVGDLFDAVGAWRP